MQNVRKKKKGRGKKEPELGEGLLGKTSRKKTKSLFTLAGVEKDLRESHTCQIKRQHNVYKTSDSVTKEITYWKVVKQRERNPNPMF